MVISIIGASSFVARTIIHQSKPSDQIQAWSRAGDLKYEYPSFGIENIDFESLSESDLIVFCAGAGIQPKHNDSNALIYELNAFEPIRLINRLRAEGYKGQLITFGSYFELGNGSFTTPQTEEQLINHNNPLPNSYCEAKRILTRYVSSLSHVEMPFKLLHLILTNVYGVGENDDRLLPYLARCFSEGNEVKLSAGTQVRQYTHVRDIAQLVLSPETPELSGIYNFTDPKAISVKQLVLKMADMAGFPHDMLRFAEIAKRDSTMSFLALSARKMEAMVSDIALTNLETGLTEYLK